MPVAPGLGCGDSGHRPPEQVDPQLLAGSQSLLQPAGVLARGLLDPEAHALAVGGEAGDGAAQSQRLLTIEAEALGDHHRPQR